MDLESDSELCKAMDKSQAVVCALGAAESDALNVKGPYKVPLRLIMRAWGDPSSAFRAGGVLFRSTDGLRVRLQKMVSQALRLVVYGLFFVSWREVYVACLLLDGLYDICCAVPRPVPGLPEVCIRYCLLPPFRR